MRVKVEITSGIIGASNRARKYPNRYRSPKNPTGYTAWCDCPIARAVKKVVKPGTRVEVMDTVQLYTFTPEGIYLPMPTKASDFIDAFDGHKKVKPFSFFLNIPKRFLAA